ncbi:Phosphoadenosine phosphosulfate reductase domain containing protein [Coccidioides posadasii C735 delta SOWgp]|uniref:FAD synthase n=1 Tax=Coccidioides posadasii (strain C735) TaxID=222929 RepID=C5PEQ4_COCP7|nr:Phosphoadenosine phosphosulfate reductase domain containing protein [Coccidioides posadasii C735 delta SOWgp]EER24574.1 Phosphoadenosine phosphosulfate reductase domain containing protein [Coccidioides posadasii C735 delta SOWgp]|eukprot:XP_003066719.1 Phosphoadenosine phosphosulfate reductase domain containing protein [Coccidioides posadasii C735 delta SOWgp]
MAGLATASPLLPNGDSAHGETKALRQGQASLSERLSSELVTCYPDTHEHAGDSTSLPSLSSVSATLHAKIQAFLSEPHDPSSLLYRVQQQTRISLSVVREALSRYKLHELSLSYNGGKDCLVLLILFLSSLHPLPEPSSTKQKTQAQQCTFKDKPEAPKSQNANPNLLDDPDDEPPTSIPAMYARPSHPFPSVETFVDSSSLTYHLSLTRYTTDPPHTTLRDTFACYLQKYPGIKAIFVGTRRTDPHGEKLTHFDRTDHGWPDFMRIHPVIDWHYVEIWAFIRHLGVEYCPLYDQGYTSLGGTNDTHPNPKLQINKASPMEASKPSNAGQETPKFRPAYELVEDEEERLGRY